MQRLRASMCRAGHRYIDQLVHFYALALLDVDDLLVISSAVKCPGIRWKFRCAMITAQLIDSSTFESRAHPT